MPYKMDYTGECHSYSKFDMPLQYCFDEKNVPFIVYLEYHEQTCNGCYKENYCKCQVPEFSMELEGIITDPVKKITD
jgi:hypothetical protein